MSEDIVNGLRAEATDAEKTLLDSYALEAADEIERLRKEVARLTLVSSLWQSEFVAAVDETKRLGKS